MSEHRVRRVVMGEPEPGVSTFAHVDEIEPLEMGDSHVYRIWGWDEPPVLPHDGVAGRPPTFEGEPYTPGHYFPPPGGVSIGATTFASTDHPVVVPMHQSDSVDIAVIVSGELTVISTDGTEVALGPGDVYVQNGALHAWRSNPDDPPHVVFINVGASRSGVPRRA